MAYHQQCLAREAIHEHELWAAREMKTQKRPTLPRPRTVPSRRDIIRVLKDIDCCL